MAISRSLSPRPNRRGQAALEFLMTYGWAILAMLVVVGSLAYFTGFYTKFLPSSCATGTPFTCTEWRADANGTIILKIQNGAGWDMSNVNVTLDCNQNNQTQRSYSQALVRNQELVNGSMLQFNCPILGTVFSGKLTMRYSQTGETFSHTTYGTMRTRVGE